MIRNTKIGPIEDLRFNIKVADYIKNSSGPGPTHPERICLRNFFQRLRSGSVTVPYNEISPRAFMVATCGHVIVFANDGRRVHSIRRGYLGEHSINADRAAR
jgi:hypothetical protein